MGYLTAASAVIAAADAAVSSRSTGSLSPAACITFSDPEEERRALRLCADDPAEAATPYS